MVLFAMFHIGAHFSAFATFNFTRFYDFEHVRLTEVRNFGSEEYFEKEYKEDFVLIAKLNQYIKGKISEGRLKNKRILITKDYLYYDLHKDYLEIYEGKDAYYVNLYLFYDTDLLKFVDYFASSGFVPLYSKHKWEKMARSMPANNFLNTTDNISICDRDGFRIKYSERSFNLYFNDRELVKNLTAPFSMLYKTGNVYLLVTTDKWYALQNGKIIKEVSLEKGLGGSVFSADQVEGNKINLKVFSSWANLYLRYAELVLSYNSITNKIYWAPER